MRKTLAIICLALLTNVGAAVPTRAAPQQPEGAAARATQAKPELEEAARLNAEVLNLFRAGKYDEALPVAKRVLELREKAAGPDALVVAYALNNLASIHTQRGRGDEAGRLYERSLAIVEKQGGAESDFAADLRMQLGLLRISSRDYKGAAPLIENALAVKERLHGGEDPALVNPLFALTDLNFLRGEPALARETLGRAVAILRKQRPKRDEATARRLKSYYCPLYAGGRDENKELLSAVSNALWRLEQPETAAEIEDERKAREALGMTGKRVVEGAVLNGRAVSKPQPEYPPGAKQSRASGLVVVRIVVDESGKVIEAEAVCGHPMLKRASEDAARAARFTPTLLSGKPVKVSGVITYNFVLL